jgi:hypothetical protein
LLGIELCPPPPKIHWNPNRYASDWDLIWK